MPASRQGDRGNQYSELTALTLAFSEQHWHRNSILCAPGVRGSPVPGPWGRQCEDMWPCHTGHGRKTRKGQAERRQRGQKTGGGQRSPAGAIPAVGSELDSSRQIRAVGWARPWVPTPSASPSVHHPEVGSEGPTGWETPRTHSTPAGKAAFGLRLTGCKPAWGAQAPRLAHTSRLSQRDSSPRPSSWRPCCPSPHTRPPEIPSPTRGTGTTVLSAGGVGRTAPVLSTFPRGR